MNKTDDELKSASEFNELLATFCAWAVVIGVAFEFVLAAWFEPPPVTLINHWGAACADAVVALGVAGEVLFGRRARLASEELTRRSEARLGEANERAAKAEQAAAEATERAIKLEQRIAGRSISNEGFAILVEMFKSLNPKPISAVLEYEIRDREAYSFAGELRQAIWEAGINLRAIERDRGGDQFGTFIGDVPPGRANKLLFGFAEAGLGASVLEGENVNKWGGRIKSSDLYIFVGTKAPEMSKSHIDRLFARVAATAAQAQKGEP